MHARARVLVSMYLWDTRWYWLLFPVYLICVRRQSLWWLFWQYGSGGERKGAWPKRTDGRTTRLQFMHTKITNIDLSWCSALQRCGFWTWAGRAGSGRLASNKDLLTQARGCGVAEGSFVCLLYFHFLFILRLFLMILPAAFNGYPNPSNL